MTETHEFVALGHAGSEAYAGLESFPNPGVSRVEMTSDELTAMCPVTAQPDFYTATIDYEPNALCRSVFFNFINWMKMSCSG